MTDNTAAQTVAHTIKDTGIDLEVPHVFKVKVDGISTYLFIIALAIIVWQNHEKIPGVSRLKSKLKRGNK